MGRNAAFGRAPALDRFRAWWEAQDPTTRTNVLLALGVGALVVVIMAAALARDPSPATPAANVIRPPTQQPAFGTPSTVVIDGLNAPETSTTSSSSTTTSTPAATTTVTSQPRTTSPSVATTAPPAPAPAPATTVTNPDVIFSEPPTTVSTVVTTLPATTSPPTTAAPATTTTTSGLPLPVGVPRPLGP